MFIADTQPGRTDRPNEDYVGTVSVPGLMGAVLLDGAGGPSELPTGCIHGTPWYVRNLGDNLLIHMHTMATTPLARILALDIDLITRCHVMTCDVNHFGTPSSTVIMARIQGDALEYLVLGDSTLVLDVNGEILPVTDRRIDEVAVDERHLMEALPTGEADHQAARLRFVAHQRRMRNRPDGYWIASNDPEAAARAVVGRVPVADVDRVAVVSDGVARFVEFGLGTWADLLDTLGTTGPQQLFARIRQAEADDPAGERWPRAKRRDDVAAAYLRTAA